MRLKSIIIIGAGILLSTNTGGAAIAKLNGEIMASNPAKASLAFDGDPTTKYYAMKDSYAWVGLDLGSPHLIKNINWYLNSDREDYVLLGMFQGANKADFSDAIPIALIENARENKLEVNCSRGFRYVRYVGPSKSYCQISELEFFGEPGEGDDSHLWQLTNLPTVSINTVNDEIPYDKEHDISCTVIIISNDGTEILEKNRTEIRERGNASREFPKKPWRIKFEKKQNVLNAPAKAKKWTLVNNYGDKTLMRNMLAFDIADKIGMKWVPFCTPVDVVLNGEYKGCYQLCDQVEVNEGRLEITEMTPEDSSGEALTGGYFIEVDGYAYEEPAWFQTSNYQLPVTIKSPNDDEIIPMQINYIRDYFIKLERLLSNYDSETGYRSIFDTRSFIQHMLVNEVAGNTDTYWSTYMYKDRDDPKIYTGPVWDFDIGFNNDFRTYPVTKTSGNSFLWTHYMSSSAGNMKGFARQILINDPATASEILEIWANARQNGLSAEWLEDRIDIYKEMIDRSQKLNFIRWPILSTTVHMNPKAYGSFQAECSAVKNYLYQQIEHLDQVIGYDPDNYGPSLVKQAAFQDNDLGAEYYTLTGLKIGKPSVPGIYIEKKGELTKKISVR